MEEVKESKASPAILDQYPELEARREHERAIFHAVRRVGAIVEGSARTDADYANAGLAMMGMMMATDMDDAVRIAKGYGQTWRCPPLVMGLAPVVQPKKPKGESKALPKKPLMPIAEEPVVKVTDALGKMKLGVSKPSKLNRNAPEFVYTETPGAVSADAVPAVSTVDAA